MYLKERTELRSAQPVFPDCGRCGIPRVCRLLSDHSYLSNVDAVFRKPSAVEVESIGLSVRLKVETAVPKKSKLGPFASDQDKGDRPKDLSTTWAGKQVRLKAGNLVRISLLIRRLVGIFLYSGQVTQAEYGVGSELLVGASGTPALFRKHLPGDFPECFHGERTHKVTSLMSHTTPA